MAVCAPSGYVIFTQKRVDARESSCTNPRTQRLLFVRRERQRAGGRGSGTCRGVARRVHGVRARVFSPKNSSSSPPNPLSRCQPPAWAQVLPRDNQRREQERRGSKPRRGAPEGRAHARAARRRHEFARARARQHRARFVVFSRGSKDFRSKITRRRPQPRTRDRYQRVEHIQNVQPRV